jgi:hypothetical protein
LVNVSVNGQISYYTIEEYCNLLVNKVYNLLCLREEKQDYIKSINKISDELIGATISDVKPFIDNPNVLEILFIISGLKKEKNFETYRTLVLDCCTQINLLPNRLSNNL